MTTDLWMLLASALLYFSLIMLAALPAIVTRGMQWASGNRDEPAEPLPTWAQRTQRTVGNMAENLILATIIILVVHLAGASNETTALGTQVFFGARVGHAVCYVGGIPYLRTLMWVVSLVGLAMVAFALA